jgi:proteasome lid subunit RPN8/RPN11
MKISFRVRREMLDSVRRDLERPHEFAFERVGFLFCRFGSLKSNGLVVLAHEYMPLMDNEYIDDARFGALIGASGFRRALEHTLTNALGIFHIHFHAHPGLPAPSGIDVRESAHFVPDFFHIRESLPHGVLIASDDSVSGRVWLAETAQPIPIATLTVVGAPMQFVRNFS